MKPQERVWMHKKTGQLYEFTVGWLGPVLFWEDTTTPERAHRPIDKESPLMFSDDPRYNANDYEDLGDL